ncbi:hypothetical protein AM1_G0132 (plasmid) [Acaryochloris marina MBIC11017]|uniref:Uncharacterized protein n=1 Tax=Acaryochloris marina (strain MBIC 11017) TaxID=329726 RepID=A8ZQM6_ACAM1|nr:hypothetical protein AM1_G0132 [Acaryochloris marina MBIC11017]
MHDRFYGNILTWRFYSECNPNAGQKTWKNLQVSSFWTDLVKWTIPAETKM